jgi:branched-chain amino acid transport system substrate-binding protein
MKARVFLAIAMPLRAGALALPASAQQDPWKISAFMAITGANAGYTADFKLGYEIALEEINRKGGIKGRPVTLSFGDTQSNPGQVATLIRQACNDALVVSNTLSQESQVAYPVANTMQCPIFSAATGAAGLTAANRPWAFSVLTPSNVSTPMAMEVVARLTKPKKVVIVVLKADNASSLYAEAAAKWLQGANVPVAETLTVGANDVDFGPVMARIAAAGPDLVVISSLDRVAMGVLKEMRKAQYKGNIMFTQSVFSPLVSQQPPELLDGIYRYAQADLPSSTDPRVKEFIKTYEARSGGRPPTFNAALPYDVMMVIKEVIESANLKGDVASRAEDRRKFIDRLNAIKDYAGLTGKMTMSAEGFMSATPTVLVYRKDKWDRVQ